MTFRQLCKGATLGFEFCNATWNIVWCTDSWRGMIFVKGFVPCWSTRIVVRVGGRSSWNDVTEAMVDAYFAPLPDGELVIER